MYTDSPQAGSRKIACFFGEDVSFQWKRTHKKEQCIANVSCEHAARMDFVLTEFYGLFEQTGRLMAMGGK